MASMADRIRATAAIHVAEARRTGKGTVSIVAGDIVRELGLTNRTPNVCSALGSKRFQAENEVDLEKRDGPASSTTTRFTYRIHGRPSSEQDGFMSLRGIAKDTFARLGGGERFLTEERESFYGR